MIVRAALRIAAVMAVAEHVWAGVRVNDTILAPLDEPIQADPTPFVTVFTGLDESTIEGRDVWAADRSLALVFEFGITSGMQRNAEGGPAVAIPDESDSAWERALDLLERRIDAALFGNPRSAWG